jgi:uncharacterized protein
MIDKEQNPPSRSPKPRSKLHVGGLTISVLITVFATYTLLGILLHDNIIYPFNQAPFSHPHGRNEMVKDQIPVTIFDSGDGSDVIFYLQGNIAARSYFSEDILAHHAAGFTVVTLNWVGSEGRGGEISEGVLKQEALEVMKAIPDLVGNSNPNIHLHGYSMGSGIAAYVASEAPAKTLTLQASYSSLCEIMSARTFLPACYLPGVDTWDNRPYVSRIEAPVLLIHGLEDTLIPPKYSRKLADMFLSDGGSLSVETYQNIGHNDYWKSEHIDRIHQFIKTDSKQFQPMTSDGLNIKYAEPD